MTYSVTAAREQLLADTATQACTGGAVAPSPSGLALCDQAAQVQTDPVPGPIGPSGADGRGILGTSIVDGRLVVTYTDGTRQDVGTVTGPAGTAGLPGVGIEATTIEDGQLVVTYTDGTRADVGTVVGAVGATGRGIASVEARDGRLMVTYTDGDVVDAGPLPPGPAGVQGDDGAPAPSVQSVTRVFADGSVETCTRTGGPDTDPVLDCVVQPAPEQDSE